jgi:hypothetical protein
MSSRGYFSTLPITSCRRPTSAWWRLGVLAQWQLEGGNYEIRSVCRLLEKLTPRVDAGAVTVLPATSH